MMNGFINLYKESGMTSQKAVTRLKILLRESGLSFQKIGHMGTLDPDGEGVLPVALGRAARLFDYLSEKRKVYYTEFVFGLTTDTLDASGQVLASGGRIPKMDEIKNIIPSLTGRVNQMPPLYSAKSVNGEKAYSLARRGEAFELKPKSVDIFSVSLLDEMEDGVFSFRIECGGGTYIRSIARDMAEALGTYGIMRYIRREQSGAFTLQSAYKLSELENGATDKIIPMDEALSAFPVYVPPVYAEKDILNGVKIALPDVPDGYFRLYINDTLIGIGDKDEAGKMYIKTRLL